MGIGNTNFGNDQGTGTVGADGFIGPTYNSVTDSITAFAGGGQASATPLTTQFNRITTVATNADSVKLPAPTATGQVVYVVNSASNSAQVFGSGTDTINGVATGTGVALAGGKVALFWAASTGTAAKWFMVLTA